MCSGNRWVGYLNMHNCNLKKKEEEERKRRGCDEMDLCAVLGYCNEYQCVGRHRLDRGRGCDKAGCISDFCIKYILYVNSHIFLFVYFVR
jgi:hypothetical protein